MKKTFASQVEKSYFLHFSMLEKGEERSSSVGLCYIIALDATKKTVNFTEILYEQELIEAFGMCKRKGKKRLIIKLPSKFIITRTQAA